MIIKSKIGIRMIIKSKIGINILNTLKNANAKVIANLLHEEYDLFLIKI